MMNVLAQHLNSSIKDDSQKEQNNIFDSQLF